MRHYGIPKKIVTMVKQSYNGMKSKIVHEGKLSEEFDVTTGVRQGCLLSPFLFLLSIDYVMRSVTDRNRN